VTHPVRFCVDDDLRRSRLTVFFRVLLVIPHFLWLTVWTYAIVLVLVFQWFATLFAGRMEEDVHGFLGRYVRYHVHVYSYLYLLANPYPRFRGLPGTYPVDLELDPPERQNRWTVFFRIVLGIPAYVFATVLGTVVYVIAFLGWFASLVLGRMPKGMRDLGAYCLRYQTQAYAYLMLLTQRYPSLAGGTTGVQRAQLGTPLEDGLDGTLG
jgi:Domain of unknown function (DUF4389)